MSALRYGTGRGRFVGQSLIYPLPIPLDPVEYFGAAVVGEDGQFYYSNGLEWIVPIEDNEILRPSALVPFSVDQRTQLRLTTFRSPAGLEQTGTIFEISSNGVDFDGALMRIIPGFGNAYQMQFPEDGFGPGDRVLWRAAYTGTGGAQSNFSVPYAQTFPDLISRPSPLTRENAITGTVRVTDFESAAIFGYGYGETQTEFYAPDATPGIDAPLITVTQNGGAITTVPIPPLVPAANYLWRSRYGGRLNAAAPVIYSNWSSPRVFFLGAASLILTYDLELATARTIHIPLGGGTVNNPLNVTIDWGDGSSEPFTTAGIKPHTYAEGQARASPSPSLAVSIGTAPVSPSIRPDCCASRTSALPWSSRPCAARFDRPPHRSSTSPPTSQRPSPALRSCSKKASARPTCATWTRATSRRSGASSIAPTAPAPIAQTGTSAAWRTCFKPLPTAR